MEVKVKKLDDDAVIPAYAYADDAGLDLVATSYEYDTSYKNHIYGTGLAIEIPKGFVGLVFPRSSNRKTSAYLTNHVGVIDSGYRGEIMITFKDRDDLLIDPEPYQIGDKIAQLIILPYPAITLVEVNELSKTERDDKGHGSSGK